VTGRNNDLRCIHTHSVTLCLSLRQFSLLYRAFNRQHLHRSSSSIVSCF